ncbi:MAG: DegT/DnrJ/EryC1/StrS family aminotransferase [Bacteroidales bacterium]|nr:DegT/DnrJ/EryC1/StrS family aminotransferase [Bacteroidales bacterium]
MQFRDLGRQYTRLKPAIDKAVLEVMSSGHFIMGEAVPKLEQRLAEYVGVKHCITCANGTDALYLALRSWNIGPGDAVFVPDFTFFASAEVVAMCGATPVFVDVDAATFNISVDDLEKKIRLAQEKGGGTPKAIIAVDLFGLPADFNMLRPIAQKHGLLLLEDGAQGFGGSIGSKRACSFGDISTTSFFPAKPLGCYGDGGAVFTDNDEWADMVRSLRVHGKGSDKYDNVRIGLNSRLDTMQAAILDVKLTVFQEYELAAVNSVARLYGERLTDAIGKPSIPEGFGSSWAQYTLVLESAEQRAMLQQRLKEEGIPSAVYYPKPMHRQSAFAVVAAWECPVAERLSSTVLSLPIHPYMEPAEVQTVADVVNGL